MRKMLYEILVVAAMACSFISYLEKDMEVAIYFLLAAILMQLLCMETKTTNTEITFTHKIPKEKSDEIANSIVEGLKRRGRSGQ